MQFMNTDTRRVSDEFRRGFRHGRDVPKDD